MYLAYSADPRMRINIGMAKTGTACDRRRIELLNSILFSFPNSIPITATNWDGRLISASQWVRTPMSQQPIATPGSRASDSAISRNHGSGVGISGGVWSAARIFNSC